MLELKEAIARHGNPWDLPSWPLGMDPMFFLCGIFFAMGEVMCGLNCLNVFGWKFEENVDAVVVCEWECGCLFGTNQVV